ncbi:MAG TPA: MvaI/BcnI family restriction endonuclease [Ignavibacteriales bacterium]|nr:MvaI/BcnI family restriction endonuclease [Ignavibacteriales bacterium]HOL80533.1 MvaI/BcnI family restriction endonuclease [Ignavibacteriales bacterium]HPP33131.1 MvaI/BcnI family restriction endonuclease [Ignavibacteriales bacterium]HRR18226.1 MvaI/BcnI family restriction endonuclease [Ignavibacteriales bacterium]HRT99589.1 MvaI/BcnI family restriction endonuclease [Ignavibacteriales bacterium]
MNCNTQGFYLITDNDKNLIILKNKEINYNLTEWSSYVIAGKFMTKLDRIILVFADSFIKEGREYFNFTEAFLLEQPVPEKFLKAFEENKEFIDLRIHIKDNNKVRNH